jgi:hypothetical protein
MQSHDYPAIIAETSDPAHIPAVVGAPTETPCCPPSSPETVLQGELTDDEDDIDAYAIYPCDIVSAMFGQFTEPPAEFIFGGTATFADAIEIVSTPRHAPTVLHGHIPTLQPIRECGES